MNCVQFDRVGSPEDVLHCVTTDKPAPRHGEVLVRMLASPVNPSDMMFIRGLYGVPPHFPQTPGFEGVGVVEESGGGLRGRLFRGKRVAVLNRAGGNWGECAVVPAAQVIPLSSSLTLEQAATFFVNPATAWIMTQEVLRIPEQAWLLQTAAASSLGKMIMRLGNARGFRTLNVIRNPRQTADLKAAGATDVVVFDPTKNSEEEFHATVNRIVGTDGLKYAVDPVGGATGSAVVSALAQDARMLVYGTLSGEPIQLCPRTLITRHLSVEGFWLSNFMDARSLPFKLRLVRRITRLIQQDVLSTEIASRFSLNEIQDAVRSAEQSPSAGKTLLLMES